VSEAEAEAVVVGRAWVLPVAVVAVCAALLVGVVVYFKYESSDALPFDYQGFDKK
jgi:hypothetical protein